jgi:hypothetical protein
MYPLEHWKRPNIVSISSELRSSCAHLSKLGDKSIRPKSNFSSCLVYAAGQGFSGVRPPGSGFGRNLTSKVSILVKYEAKQELA